jgi:hypothetical protein
MIPSNRRIVLEGEAIEEVRNNVSNAQQLAQTANGEAGTGTVIFDVQPNVSESGSASYFEIGDIRQAANLLVYMGSPSREFSINGRFVSRSEKEARKNLKYVRRLRSWRMPEKEGSDINLKAPSRLKMRGLGNWFNNIHVRLVNLTIESPEDVDYIRVEGVDVPIIWPVSVSLKETRSVDELRDFNIEDFRQGNLPTW